MSASVELGEQLRAAIKRQGSDGLTQLTEVCAQLAELRIQRDQLIRAHKGSLREIGKAAGLSPETVRLIKKEEK